MRNRFLVGAGVALAAALSWAPAQAQLFAAPAGPGAWYFGGEGGWTQLNDANFGGPLSATEKFNDGYNIGVRGGYEWGPWRFEEEFNFRQSGITSVGPIATTGNRNTYAVMTNAIYDFGLGWAFTPHIGAGIGAVGIRDGLGIKGLGTVVNDTEWEFGYQAIAGVRYNINPNLAFDIDYRYLATTDPTFKFGGGGASTPICVGKTCGSLAGGSYTSGYATHNIVASLTMRF